MEKDTRTRGRVVGKYLLREEIDDPRNNSIFSLKTPSSGDVNEHALTCRKRVVGPVPGANHRPIMLAKLVRLNRSYFHPEGDEQFGMSLSSKLFLGI